jgi:hypothetical protein
MEMHLSSLLNFKLISVYDRMLNKLGCGSFQMLRATNKNEEW